MASKRLALAALAVAVLAWNAVGNAQAEGDRGSRKATSPQKNFQGQPAEEETGNSGYQANDPNAEQPAQGSPNPPPNSRSNNSGKGTRQGSRNEGR